jgi:hypothetical protein
MLDTSLSTVVLTVRLQPAPVVPAVVAALPRQRTKQTARKTIGSKAPRNGRTRVHRTVKPPTPARWDNCVYNGSFRVVSPYFAKEWPDYVQDDRNFKLRVLASSTGAHLWGSFELGAITGLFKTSAGPPSEVDPECDASFTVRFKWRGYVFEQGRRQMTSSSNNTGSITFSGGRPLRIEGVFDGSFFDPEEATFTGTAIPNMMVEKEELRYWKDEWRDINDEGYDAARGGWVKEPRAESPALSDTSGGFVGGSDHDDRDEESEDESDEN